MMILVLDAFMAKPIHDATVVMSSVVSAACFATSSACKSSCHVLLNVVPPGFCFHIPYNFLLIQIK